MLNTLKQSLRAFLEHRWRLPVSRERLRNLARCGFRPRRIVDIGAFEGDWSKLARGAFPDAELILVEPQSALQAPLERLARRIGNAQVYCALLDRTQRTRTFIHQASNSRILDDAIVDAGVHRADDTAVLKSTTLDQLCGSLGGCWPEFLKLDVQGAELAVLDGAERALDAAEVVQLEVSIIRIGAVPAFDEVLAVMMAKGFRLYDLMDVNYRPRDQALWQLDALFVRDDSSLVASLAWGKE